MEPTLNADGWSEAWLGVASVTKRHPRVRVGTFPHHERGLIPDRGGRDRASRNRARSWRQLHYQHRRMRLGASVVLLTVGGATSLVIVTAIRRSRARKQART